MSVHTLQRAGEQDQCFLTCFLAPDKGGLRFSESGSRLQIDAVRGTFILRVDQKSFIKFIMCDGESCDAEVDSAEPPR
jgi:hypothetical protein